MHLGSISFCDRIGYNIKSNEVKKNILDALETKFLIKIIQKHYFKVEGDVSMKHITATPHSVTIRTNGNPYLLYYTTYDGTPIMYFIDKKIHPSYQLPRIIIGRGQFDEELFKDTLLDGEMVKLNDNRWCFMINDIIAYKGMHLIKKTLPDRLNIIYNLLETEYTQDTNMDVCMYRVKQYFNLCVDTLEKIKFIKYPFTIRGIYFWAYNLKYKPKLINIDDSVIKDVNVKIKEQPDFNISISKRELLLTKTDTPDIYNVSNDRGNDLGIACVQSLSLSLWLREIFKKSTVANSSKRFLCVWNEKWSKWVPEDHLKD
tara:strand:- start:2987 stop:3934 length:948 start_codon:yes stop_codon:yes gene_type:complete